MLLVLFIAQGGIGYWVLKHKLWLVKKEMKRIFLCAVLTIASAFSAHAQTITVKDLTTLEAISGAYVYISANNIELPEFIGKTNNEGIIVLQKHFGSFMITTNGYEVKYLPTSEVSEGMNVFFSGFYTPLLSLQKYYTCP